MADPTYGGFTILSSPFFVEGVLPFILVFSLVFAVLQKSEVLGKGKSQLDALVSFSVALLTIAFANAVNVIVQLIPVLAVGLVVILVFMVLWGSVIGKHEGISSPVVKWAFGILILIVVAGATLYYTGAIDEIQDYFDTSSDGLWTNILFIVLIVGAIAVVMGFSGKSGSEKKE
jgi:hypothetical protein